MTPSLMTGGRPWRAVRMVSSYSYVRGQDLVLGGVGRAYASGRC